MARILYGLSGLGYGHATRGRSILEKLDKKHNILILTDRYAYDYLSKYFSNINKMCTETIYFSNNKVAPLRTVLANLRCLPAYIKTIAVLLRTVKNFKPDLIINDFTCVLNYLGFFLRIPVISIDNESIITSARIEIPKNKLLSFIRTYLIVKLLTLTATKKLIPSFFKTQARDKDNTCICRPSLRKEILNQKPGYGSHILVYRYSDVGDDLISVLSKLPERFIVYGFKDSCREHSNIQLKEVGNADYLKDLSNCKAIISYGGFSLTTEALYLKKPVFAIPIKGQFEQELNAYYIDKLGYGIYSKEIHSANLKQFLKNLASYKKNIKNYNPGYEELLPVLEKTINRLAH